LQQQRQLSINKDQNVLEQRINTQADTFYEMRFEKLIFVTQQNTFFTAFRL